MENTLTNDYFEKLVIAYKKCKNEQITSELCNAFIELIEKILTLWNKSLKANYGEEVIQDILFTCFDKVSNYDPEKRRAFNYFTTIIMCQLRQCYRRNRDYNKLKEKYTEWLEAKKQ